MDFIGNKVSHVDLRKAYTIFPAIHRTLRCGLFSVLHTFFQFCLRSDILLLYLPKTWHWFNTSTATIQVTCLWHLYILRPRMQCCVSFRDIVYAQNLKTHICKVCAFYADTWIIWCIVTVCVWSSNVLRTPTSFTSSGVGKILIQKVKPKHVLLTCDLY